ncbi:MAG TPA: phosphatase PAP2 family protein [Chitinophaga sp.]|uniref:phosphatase PAP2 family protein n=1 Tax=Chitinophaga sp. TaxID=1869181 RepID=UPI002DBFC5AC|nr:phosphatase PAP2 family protein [Chitinophaga sp.]HEU4555777.1 phosphatase PAP2 family protein [Chitinophaga sp.]
MKTFVTLFRKNTYFFLPLLLWVLAGGFMQSIFTPEELFRGINQTHNSVADVLMTGLTYLGDGAAFAVVLVCTLIARKYKLFLIGLVSILAVALIVQTAKHAIDAPRPLLYFQNASFVHVVKWVSVHYHNSFPSGHSAGAFALFCYLALIDNNKLRGLLFVSLALVAAYSRIYLAQHFFADIYIGSIIGTGCSFIVYSLFEFKNLTKTPVLCSNAAETALLAEPNLG